jgi:hypothetical protein
MLVFNQSRVNGGLTFVADNGCIKNILDEMVSAVEHQREIDKVLLDTGTIDKVEFYNRELAYTRLERLIYVLN